MAREGGLAAEMSPVPHEEGPAVRLGVCRWHNRIWGAHYCPLHNLR